ncbi:MAG: hypothetical protein WD708_07920 [Kiritimatiellia bacterium]
MRFHQSVEGLHSRLASIQVIRAHLGDQDQGVGQLSGLVRSGVRSVGQALLMRLMCANRIAFFQVGLEELE